MTSSPNLSAIHDPIVGILHLTLPGARGLPKMDLNGLADPYVEVHFGGARVHKTAIIKKTLNPVWNETCNIIIRQSQALYAVTLKVWDWDKATHNDFIGEVELEVGQIMTSSTFDNWITIIKEKKDKTKERGELQVIARIITQKEVNSAFWTSICRHFSHMEDDELTYPDFTALITTVNPSFPEPDINLLFESSDLNHDGTIQLSELEHMFNNTQTGAELCSKILSGNPDLIWEVYTIADSYSTIADIVLHKSGTLKSVTPTGHKAKVILVHNRETGKLEEEKIPHYIEVSLRAMYATSSGRHAVNNQQVKKLLRYLTHKTGKKYSSAESVKEIQHFVKFHSLNVDEILEPIHTFANFNEFFFRKLKPSARPIHEPNDTRVAVSPADCRLHVFPNIDMAKTLWIKGKNFNVASLIQDEFLAEQYEGGSIVIARLSPQDYHRFHSPVDGIVGKSKLIDGGFLTVNPIAVQAKDVEVYCENIRCVTPIRTPSFGEVLFISVGATMVGSINLTVTEGQSIRHGDEVGYFAFGGSTILLLFKSNTIEYDNDLIVNSAKPIETYVKVGTSLGKSSM